MAGKTKVNVGPANAKLILGIDLMHGNIFLNTAGAQGLHGLPLNANGKFSMTLQSLRNPDQLGTYTINGQQNQITHREALTRFAAAAAGERYRLPPDFVTNVLTLAECEEEMVRTVLLSPAATAKETLQEAEASHRILGQFGEQARTYSKDKNSRDPQIAALIETYLNGQNEIKTRFHQMQHAILDNQPQVVRSLAQEIRLKGDELARLHSTIQGRIQQYDVKHTGLLSGTLSISPGKELTVIPRNRNGDQSFCLSDLIEHPDEKINIFVDNQLQIVKKKEALKLY